MTMYRIFGGISLFLGLLFLFSCKHEAVISPWRTVELAFHSKTQYKNPYVDIDLSVSFTSNQGDSLIRLAFWDGGSTWKVRFASPKPGVKWTWESISNNTRDSGLHGRSGSIRVGQLLNHEEHGLLKMSRQGRNAVFHDGTPFFMVSGTAWAMPFRATLEQVEHYAKTRHDQGYNSTLLMSLQPDIKAEGPEGRNLVNAFERTFEDLHQGHINQLKPGYFQYLDSIVDILHENEIVPIFQPVFHGYGWKGLTTLGTKIEAEEYVRYCKYLLARYGSRPAIWLLSADNNGQDAGVKESGEMLEKWDCDGQPTGIHYNPFGIYEPEWAKDYPDTKCMHYDSSYQSADWLDFQWTQTGHKGLHDFSKVARMWKYKPAKGIANAEPTYEGMYNGTAGLDLWQMEEAWGNLMHGGTMGVFYGAAGLFQWKITPDEEGWQEWLNNDLSWEQALDLSGARYVGNVGKILSNFDPSDMEVIRLDTIQAIINTQNDLVAYLKPGEGVHYEKERSSLFVYDPRSATLLTRSAHSKASIMNRTANAQVILVK